MGSVDDLTRRQRRALWRAWERPNQEVISGVDVLLELEAMGLTEEWRPDSLAAWGASAKLTDKGRTVASAVFEVYTASGRPRHTVS